MTKNNKGLIITLIVLLGVIAITLIGIMIFVMTGKYSFLPFHEKKVFFDESYSVSDVSAISINSDMGDITVKCSLNDEIRVIADGNNYDDFSVETVNGVLNVKSKNSSKTLTGMRGKFYGADIDIYLPAGLKSLSISASLGDIKLEDNLAGDFTIDNSMGNIKCSSVTGTINFHTNMGDIDIDSAFLTGDSQLETDMGDIEIDKLNPVNIISKTSFGNSDVEGSDISSEINLRVETSMGDIDINN